MSGLNFFKYLAAVAPPNPPPTITTLLLLEGSVKSVRPVQAAKDKAVVPKSIVLKLLLFIMVLSFIFEHLKSNKQFVLILHQRNLLHV